MPTAMVARNLERDADFLHPKVDTGPFPNWFLVEPPIYAGVVAGLTRLTSWPLERTGRLISAFAFTLGAWGLFGLVRRREGETTAAVALGLFALFPVSIRFGRAFQPDAFMVGLALAGLGLYDSGRKFSGWFCLALGLATKVSGAFVLLPFVVGIDSHLRDAETDTLADLTVAKGLPTSSGQLFRIIAAVSILIPAALWYAYVWTLMGRSTHETSSSAGIAANWINRLTSVSATDGTAIVRDLIARAFTPVGFGLLLAGLLAWKSLRPIWKSWLLGVGVSFAALAGKLHHEYYWLMAAPIVAVIGAIGWRRLGRFGQRPSLALLAIFVGLSLFQTRSTWSTPPEWQNLTRAGSIVKELTPSNAIIVGPEALIYASDRLGCRLEWEPTSMVRAAGEWRKPLKGNTEKPGSMVSFYRKHGKATWFADLQSEAASPRRQQLHDSLRNSPKNTILVDEPGGLLLIRLAVEGSSDD